MSIVYDDTDVLLCLLHYFGDLFVSTILVTQRNTMSLRLSGWDQTGKFYGHEKLSCWQAFLPSLSGVIKAFQNLGVDLGNQGKDSLVKDVMDFYWKKRPSTIRNQSQYDFLLQWKRLNKLSRGHISLLYNGIITHCFTKFSWSMWHLVGNRMMLTTFIYHIDHKPTFIWIYHRTQLMQV